MRPMKDSPWKRDPEEIESGLPRGCLMITNTIYGTFYCESIENRFFDITTKTIVLKVSGAVVGLLSRNGDNLLFKCTGTIIECSKQQDGTHLSTILTSASIVESCVMDDSVQVDICTYDETVFVGRLFAHDTHYNLAIFHIRSDRPLPTANLRCIDDSMSLDPRERVCPSNDGSEFFRIFPGDKVLAIGRYDVDSYLMVAPGELSTDCVPFDCKELLRTTCLISKPGIGGPLVNSYGEVIGINFIDAEYTPFLPSNIISRWLSYFKEHGRFRRPCLGIQITNLYNLLPSKLEHFIRSFPNTFKGVVVEKVTCGSPADSAGLLAGDVIVQFNTDVVSGFLQFWGKIFDNVGEYISLGVIREENMDVLIVTILVTETSDEAFNSWPLANEGYVQC